MQNSCSQGMTVTGYNKATIACKQCMLMFSTGNNPTFWLQLLQGVCHSLNILLHRLAALLPILPYGLARMALAAAVQSVATAPAMLLQWMLKADAIAAGSFAIICWRTNVFMDVRQVWQVAAVAPLHTPMLVQVSWPVEASQKHSLLPAAKLQVSPAVALQPLSLKHVLLGAAAISCDMLDAATMPATPAPNVAPLTLQVLKWTGSAAVLLTVALRTTLGTNVQFAGSVVVMFSGHRPMSWHSQPARLPRLPW
jgi:hypothetical protein